MVSINKFSTINHAISFQANQSKKSGAQQAIQQQPQASQGLSMAQISSDTLKAYSPLVSFKGNEDIDLGQFKLQPKHPIKPGELTHFYGAIWPRDVMPKLKEALNDEVPNLGAKLNAIKEDLYNLCSKGPITKDGFFFMDKGGDEGYTKYEGEMARANAAIIGIQQGLTAEHSHESRFGMEPDRADNFKVMNAIANVFEEFAQKKPDNEYTPKYIHIARELNNKAAFLNKDVQNPEVAERTAQHLQSVNQLADQLGLMNPQQVIAEMKEKLADRVPENDLHSFTKKLDKAWKQAADCVADPEIPAEFIMKGISFATKSDEQKHVIGRLFAEAYAEQAQTLPDSNPYKKGYEEKAQKLADFSNV